MVLKHAILKHCFSQKKTVASPMVNIKSYLMCPNALSVMTSNFFWMKSCSIKWEPPERVHIMSSKGAIKGQIISFNTSVVFSGRVIHILWIKAGVNLKRKLPAGKAKERKSGSFWCETKNCDRL